MGSYLLKLKQFFNESTQIYEYYINIKWTSTNKHHSLEAISKQLLSSPYKAHLNKIATISGDQPDSVPPESEIPALMELYRTLLVSFPQFNMSFPKKFSQFKERCKEYLAKQNKTCEFKEDKQITVESKQNTNENSQVLAGSYRLSLIEVTAEDHKSSFQRPCLQWMPTSEFKPLSVIFSELQSPQYAIFLINGLAITGETADRSIPDAEIPALYQFYLEITKNIPQPTVLYFEDTFQAKFNQYHINYNPLVESKKIQKGSFADLQKFKKFALQSNKNTHEDSRLAILSLIFAYLQLKPTDKYLIFEIFLAGLKNNKMLLNNLRDLFMNMEKSRQQYSYPPHKLKTLSNNYQQLLYLKGLSTAASKAKFQNSAPSLIRQFDPLKLIFGKFTCNIYTSDIDLSNGSGAFTSYQPISALKSKNLTEYGTTQCEDNTLQVLFSYLKDNHLLRRNESELVNCLLIGNGSTELYNVAIRSIMNEKLYRTVSNPVFIMPVPTYGLFIEQITHNHADVFSLELLKENDYKVTPDQLRKCIDQINTTKLKQDLDLVNARLTKIFEQINYPSKDRFEFKQNENIHEIEMRLDEFSKELKLMSIDDLPELLYPGRAVGIVIINPHNPLGCVYSQSEIEALAVVTREQNLSVIADHVHQHINPDNLPIGSFGNLKPESKLFKTYILLSLSKHLCVADARLGFLYASPDICSHVHYIATHEILFTGKMKENMLVQGYKKDKQLQEYIEQGNTQYQARRSLANLLVNGIKQLKHLVHMDGIFISQAEKDEFLKLISGLPKVSQLVKPQATFFTVLDFTQWKDSQIADITLDTGIKFTAALNILTRVFVIFNEGLAFPSNEKLIARLSYSVHLADLIEGISRLHEFLGNLKKAEPDTSSTPRLESKK